VSGVTPADQHTGLSPLLRLRLMIGVQRAISPLDPGERGRAACGPRLVLQGTRRPSERRLRYALASSALSAASVSRGESWRDALRRKKKPPTQANPEIPAGQLQCSGDIAGAETFNWTPMHMTLMVQPERAE